MVSEQAWAQLLIPPLGLLFRVHGSDNTINPTREPQAREACPVVTVAELVDTMEMVVTDQVEVEALVAVVVLAVVVAVVHMVVQAMDQAAMEVAEVEAVEDSHSHHTTSTQCPLQ